jgi:predicted ArsR family transcriptional regulator
VEEERIELSARERERLKVLHEGEQGHLRRVDAAHRLRLSARRVRRLLQRLHTGGDRGLVHGLRGRPSNRRMAQAIGSALWRHNRLAELAGGPLPGIFRQHDLAGVE